MRLCLSLLLIALCGLLCLPSPASSCRLCVGNIQQMKTMRQDAAEAKLLLYGSLANPRLAAGDTGSTDLRIEKVLKTHDFLGNKTTVGLPRYIPVQNPKDPPRFIVFCDVYKDKL